MSGRAGGKLVLTDGGGDSSSSSVRKKSPPGTPPLSRPLCPPLLCNRAMSLVSLLYPPLRPSCKTLVLGRPGGGTQVCWALVTVQVHFSRKRLSSTSSGHRAGCCRATRRVPQALPTSRSLQPRIRCHVCCRHRGTQGGERPPRGRMGPRVPSPHTSPLTASRQ